MKLPIIVYEHGDILVFPDEASVCDYLEPIDVTNNEYVAYDSSGNIIELAVQRKTTRSRFVGTSTVDVVVIEGMTGRNSAAELESRIRRFLAAAGFHADVADMELRELVNFADNFLSE